MPFCCTILIGIIAAHTQVLNHHQRELVLSEIKLDELKIFHNPATDLLSIRINSNLAELTEIIIYVGGGQKVYILKFNFDRMS